MSLINYGLGSFYNKDLFKSSERYHILKKVSSFFVETIDSEYDCFWMYCAFIKSLGLLDEDVSEEVRNK